MMVENIAWAIVLPAISLAVALCFIRLVRGPSIPDRVVALDLITTLGIGITAVFAIATDTPLLLDVAMVVALISFLGTIAFAYYVERSA